MNKFTFRLAGPEDVTETVAWVQAGLKSGLIDPKDVEAAKKANNPTAVYFIVECGGKPVTFCPVYCQLAVSHLAFDPKTRASIKMQALRTMLDGLVAFGVQFGIREIVTMTKSGYPIAEFARKKLGFVPDPRELYKLNINTLLPPKS